MNDSPKGRFVHVKFRCLYKGEVSSLLGKIRSLLQEQVRGNTLPPERTISISTEGLRHAAISVTEQPFVPFRVEESRALSKESTEAPRKRRSFRLD